MPVSMAALAAEINNDPKALGYAALKASGSDADLAAKINATYVGVGSVWRTNVTAAELLSCIVWAEVSAFTAVKWAAVQVFLTPLVLDASQQRIRDFFAGAFSGCAATLANMSAMAKVTAPSRAEELWGAGNAVSATDIARALGRS